MSLITHAQNVLFVAACFGLLFLSLRYVYRLAFSPIRNVPGPLYTRFTSLIYRWYALRSERVDYIHSLHERYGKVVRVSPDEVSISDLPSVQAIHRISTPFLKSSWYFDFTGRQPPALFSFRDPHAHRTRRSLLASPMSETALKKFEPTVNTNIHKTIDGIEKEYKQTGVVDLLKWFTFMATDVIGELTFAESFRMLDHGKPNQYYHDLRDTATLAQFRVEVGNLVFLLGALHIEPFNKALALIKRTTAYALQSVKRYEQHVEENGDDAKPTLFTKLYTKEADGAISHDGLVREGVAYIIAGSDTTAVTTTYAVWNICRKPAIRAKLLAELSTIPESFTWDDLRNLPYLNNTITETLRLDGAAPGSLKRDVPASGATLSGYTLPGGTIVSTQAWTLHRDKEIWGPDAETFDPDRWLAPTPEMNHAFMAFGGGTRVCIGQNLARDEMRFALASFFRAFPDARVVESDEGMAHRAYFLTAPKADRCLADLRLKRDA